MRRRAFVKRFARFVCRIIGHKWTVWVPLPIAAERCTRCLDWKSGHPPFWRPSIVARETKNGYVSVEIDPERQSGTIVVPRDPD